MADLELFECNCGGRVGREQRFFIAAKDFMTGMAAVFDRFSAKTDEDLPKPFLFERVKVDFIVVNGKKRKS